MKYIFVGVCAFLFCQSGFSSLFLYNNTPFVLKAQIIAANGADMGEMLLQPGQQEYTKDQLGSANPIGTDPDINFKNYENSLTPFQVFWYCEEGDLYGACTTVSAGATVMASSCSGSKACRPKKQEKAQSPDEYNSP